MTRQSIALAPESALLHSAPTRNLRGIAGVMRVGVSVLCSAVVVRGSCFCGALMGLLVDDLFLHCGGFNGVLLVGLTRRLDVCLA